LPTLLDTFSRRLSNAPFQIGLAHQNQKRQTAFSLFQGLSVKKTPFRLTPYQVQWLLVVGFVTVGYAIYVRYLAIEFSGTALACDAGLQTLLCKSRSLATTLFRNSVFGITALVIAVLHVIRPSIVLLTLGLIAAGLGIVLYNVVLSGLAIGLLILGFARPAPATA
jgi:hypothetical protein